jgi:cytochrome c oxidase subunit 1
MVTRAVVEVGALAALAIACLALYLRVRPPVESDGGTVTREGLRLELDRVREGTLRWLTTTDHRDIGILYVVFGTAAGLWGGVDAMMLRTELLTPPADIWTPETYNALFTTHGLTMLIFFVLPVFFGIGNYFVPLLIGADDMAFPRVNAVGFWLLPPALLLARGGLFVQVGGQLLSTVFPADAIRFFLTLREVSVGWTLYAPLSTQSANPQLDLLLLGLHLSGIATTVGAINFIVTVVYERGEGVGWANLDIFSWNMLTTSGLALFAFPLLGSALIMLLIDRNFGTTFFAADGGGAVLWQHLFWFWGHPEVYILFLPATGLMSTILPKFVGRKLFGYRFIVYSTLGLGVLSFGVWAHHMFVTGIDPRVRASFMAVSIAIAVPSAIKVFNWITTIWDGQVRVTAPFILLAGSIGTFIVGGVTGVFLAVIPVNVLYHGTYYVVGHFHLIVVGIIPFAMMAASYYWYPLMTGRWYDTRLAKFQAVLVVFGSSVTFLTLLVIGGLGLPRRQAIYPPEFQLAHQIATVGAFLVGLAALLWLYNMVASYFRGPVVESTDPWGLKATGQFTREWQWFEQRQIDRYDVEPTEPETTRRSYVPAEGPADLAGGGVGAVARAVVRDASAAAAGGFVGTVLMSGGLGTAILIGVLDPASFGELAALVGLPASPVLGAGLFLVGGTVTWPLLFVAFREYLPGRLAFETGLVFATIIASGFAIAFYTGQSGLELVGYLAFVVVAHWAYGLGLAVTLQLFRRRRERRTGGGGGNGNGSGNGAGTGGERGRSATDGARVSGTGGRESDEGDRGGDRGGADGRRGDA